MLCIRRMVIHSHFPEAAARNCSETPRHTTKHTNELRRPNPDFQTMVHAPGTLDLERPHVRVRAAQRGARGLFLSLALGYGHTRM